ncbi:MAG: YtxH domain-containing protein [Balneolaceae bacterium]|nr:MAG: YtxH domain-containing protein [Balneolaceae bacterium]
MNAIKSLIILMLGTMVGTIIGFLFAPDKGTNTRKELLRKGKKSMDNMSDEVRKVQKQLNKYAGQLMNNRGASSSEKEDSERVPQKRTEKKGIAGTKATPRQSRSRTKTSVKSDSRSTSGSSKKSGAGSSARSGS